MKIKRKLNRFIAYLIYRWEKRKRPDWKKIAIWVAVLDVFVLPLALYMSYRDFSRTTTYDIEFRQEVQKIPEKVVEQLKLSEMEAEVCGIDCKLIKYAQLYRVSVNDLRQVMMCESGGNPLAWNKNDPNGGSRGLFQFQEATFFGAAQALGIANPDIWNVEQQIQTTAYLFSENKQCLWTCARKYGICHTE